MLLVMFFSAPSLLLLSTSVFKCTFDSSVWRYSMAFRARGSWKRLRSHLWLYCSCKLPACFYYASNLEYISWRFREMFLLSLLEKYLLVIQIQPSLHQLSVELNRAENWNELIGWTCFLTFLVSEKQSSIKRAVASFALIPSPVDVIPVTTEFGGGGHDISVYWKKLTLREAN